MSYFPPLSTYFGDALIMNSSPNGGKEALRCPRGRGEQERVELGQQLAVQLVVMQKKEPQELQLCKYSQQKYPIPVLEGELGKLDLLGVVRQLTYLPQVRQQQEVIVPWEHSKGSSHIAESVTYRLGLLIHHTKQKRSHAQRSDILPLQKWTTERQGIKVDRLVQSSRERANQVHPGCYRQDEILEESGGRIRRQ